MIAQIFYATLSLSHSLSYPAAVFYLLTAKNLNEIENKIDLVSVSFYALTVFGVVVFSNCHSFSLTLVHCAYALDSISSHAGSNCAESPNLIFNRIHLPLCTHNWVFCSFLSVMVLRF